LIPSEAPPWLGLESVSDIESTQITAWVLCSSISGMHAHCLIGHSGVQPFKHTGRQLSRWFRAYLLDRCRLRGHYDAQLLILDLRCCRSRPHPIKNPIATILYAVGHLQLSAKCSGVGTSHLERKEFASQEKAPCHLAEVDCSSIRTPCLSCFYCQFSPDFCGPHHLRIRVIIWWRTGMRSFPSRACKSSRALQGQSDFVLFGGLQDVRSGLAGARRDAPERQLHRVLI
jgi:hypothetical protein